MSTPSNDPTIDPATGEPYTHETYADEPWTDPPEAAEDDD